MKQRFAKTYRDGQAKIINAVREELQSAIDALRVPPNTTLPQRSALLTVSNGLAALRAEYPAAATKFEAGLRKHDLAGPQDERLIWSILLVTYAALILANADNASGLNATLLTSLTSAHRLPRLEDGIEDAETYAFLDDHLDDFLALDGQGEDLGPSDVLDDPGLTFVKAKDGEAAFVDGPTENLGVRLLMWGMSVSQADVLPVVRQAGVDMCLFVEGADGKGEWMYRDE